MYMDIATPPGLSFNPRTPRGVRRLYFNSFDLCILTGDLRGLCRRHDLETPEKRRSLRNERGMRKMAQARTCGAWAVCLGFALQDQGAFGVVCGLGASVFHAPLPVGSQEVEAKAVSGGFNNGEKLSAKLDPKGGFKKTFKHRELHPLTMILTQFGDMPETPFSFSGFSPHVICHKHHHA
jgi:hypothetical protein